MSDLLRAHDPDATRARHLLDRAHAETPVIRAWPKIVRHGSTSRGELIFEWRDDQDRVRAGRVEADHLTTGEYGQDRRLGDLTDLLDDGARVVAHRWGRRMVITGPDTVVKAMRPTRTAAVAAAMRTLQGPCQHAAVATPAVREATESRIVMDLLPGATLHDLAEEAGEGWEAFAHRWPEVAGAGPEIIEGLGRHDAEVEAQVLATWISHLHRFDLLPDTRKALTSAAERVVTALLDDLPDRHVVLHRDLHDKQVLWDGQTLGVLDVDTAARGEAALDLGNLLTHLQLRAVQGRLSQASAADYAALLHPWCDRLGISEARLATYRRAAGLRLACVYAFRPADGPWLEEWIDQLLGRSATSLA